MAITYSAISTITVPVGGAASIDFQNIPQTYTDLLLQVSSREETSATGTLVVEFNGTTANRSEWKIQGNAVNATSSTTSDFQFISDGSNYTANTFGNATFYIPSYTNTSNNKSWASISVGENNVGNDALLRLTTHLWANNSAITRITIKPNPGGSGGDINEYSTATLYGINNTV